LSKQRIYFFSGMGADARLLESQRAIDAEIITLPWIATDAIDSFATYATKLAATIDTSKPFYVGGASLGGMLAYQMASELGPNLRGLILIVSADSCCRLPLFYRVIGRLVALLPTFTLRIGKSMVPALRKLFGISTKEQTQLFQSMLADSDPRFLKWSLRAVLTWQGPQIIAKVPMLWIHAGRDFIIPYAKAIPGVVVADAGHTVNMTHAAEVNRIISDWLDEQANQPAAPYNIPYEQPATEVK